MDHNRATATNGAAESHRSGRAALRVTLVGGLAMGLTALIGQLVGTT
jgi:VIT1/CCC1 family predicted Fe2+/Mn2+ transporter